jgi:hypothetical protein
MFPTPAMDVAIGLILMYLMLSLLCTVVNEFIATKLSLRSKSLAAAIEQLIDDKTLRDTFYKHGVIAGAMEVTKPGTQSTVSAVISIASTMADGVKKMIGRGPATSPPPAPNANQKVNHPSYLAGSTVALALIGSLDPTTPVPGIAEIKKAALALPAGAVRDAVLSNLMVANDDVDKLRTSIATWYDDSMERLSGAYKRQLKWITMLIGLAVAVVFNADSLKVATTLWNDPDRRALVVESATKVVPLPKNGQPTTTGETLRPLPIGWNCDVIEPAKPAATTPSVWKCATREPPTTMQIAGWLLTAAALSLGAPFWFDLLGKFMNVRGAGAKPARADAQAN